MGGLLSVASSTTGSAAEGAEPAALCPANGTAHGLVPVTASFTTGRLAADVGLAAALTAAEDALVLALGAGLGFSRVRVRDNSVL